LNERNREDHRPTLDWRVPVCHLVPSRQEEDLHNCQKAVDRLRQDRADYNFIFEYVDYMEAKKDSFKYEESYPMEQRENEGELTRHEREFRAFPLPEDEGDISYCTDNESCEDVRIGPAKCVSCPSQRELEVQQIN
jgi:hypothetical protein